MPAEALVLPASFHRGAPKHDTPKYPNYTCTSCPFVSAGILLLCLPLPTPNPRRHKVDDCPANGGDEVLKHPHLFRWRSADQMYF